MTETTSRSDSVDAPTILVEISERVATITLNRPQALNALNFALMTELTDAIRSFESNADVAVVIITGSLRAFAAGADITEMREKEFTEMYLTDWLSGWDQLLHFRKPVIAAVAGFALGGGCELAMICDIIIAADTAHFGQPEVKLGITPGIGGSQRLTRAIGKSKAMEMCLTGRMMDALEAERCGLVSRVVPAESLIEETRQLALTIANGSLTANMMIKDCVNRSFESSLNEGLRYERRTFHAAFATADQKEGMAAFVEKRSPQFKKD